MDYPKVKICLNTSDDDLAKELYQPCLQWATRFDRGVGYFTTGWLMHNIAGLSDFASRGGVMRLITSPILSNEDSDAIIASVDSNTDYKIFEEALSKNVDALKAEMESDILNAFSWMLYDGIIEMKFGKSLLEALEDMKKRMPSETINNILLNITQTDVFGNSILETMYNQIDFLSSSAPLKRYVSGGLHFAGCCMSKI